MSEYPNEVAEVVTAIRTTYTCPICQNGKLEYIGIKRVVHGDPHFDHRCSGCGHFASLTTTYPKLEVQE